MEKVGEGASQEAHILRWFDRHANQILQRSRPLHAPRDLRLWLTRCQAPTQNPCIVLSLFTLFNTPNFATTKYHFLTYTRLE
ncbi:hypothetical protein OPQ81_005617 [Rhizoctonia solani]|nr:hypothetical protein OPQ81_005617 [Rhizoctonia solani]